MDNSPSISDPKPTGESFRFSLRDLMWAMVCFAITSAQIAFCMNQPSGPDFRSLRNICFGIMSPVIGASIGLGIGILLNRRKLWVIMMFWMPVPVLVFLWLAT